MRIIGVIPARFGSSRFPGKPLTDIGGKTMIRRVYEQALKAQSLSDVIVATDDERIYKEIQQHQGHVALTGIEHKNGTERCAEIARLYEAEVIINIQGDEPFINPAQIDVLAALFKTASVQIATLIKEHPLDEALQNPSRIKVAVNKNMEALYFSRSVIPYSSGADTPYYKHIGIYAYRATVLQQLVQLPPSPLELAESLEQLRWLENGYRITCALTGHESVSIDTPEDLKLVQHLI